MPRQLFLNNQEIMGRKNFRRNPLIYIVQTTKRETHYKPIKIELQSVIDKQERKVYLRKALSPSPALLDTSTTPLTSCAFFREIFNFPAPKISESWASSSTSAT